MPTNRQDDGSKIRRDRAMDRLVADALRLDGLNPDRLGIQSGFVMRPNDGLWYIIRVRFHDLYRWSQDRSQKIYLTVEHGVGIRTPQGKPLIESEQGRIAWADMVLPSTLVLAHSGWTTKPPEGAGRAWPSGYPRPKYNQLAPAKLA